MRCRKARSCLSAFCNGELGERQAALIREHLADCPVCRAEAQAVSTVMVSRKQMPTLRVSGDFNSRLLHRIAQERFAETRTQAFLPHRAPVIGWGRLATVSAATLLIFVVAGFGYFSWHEGGSDSRFAGSGSTSGRYSLGSDDSYLTAQPVGNGGNVALTSGWSFRDQLAKVERLNRLTSHLTDRGGFATSHLASSQTLATGMPVVNVGNRVIPSVRVYQTVTAGSTGEGARTY